MKKAYRVKNNKDFQHILNVGKSFANRELVIYYKEKPSQRHFRVGISVGKNIGNAVIRNKIKRHIREAFMQLDASIENEVDIIIIARRPTIHMNTMQMKRSITHLLKKQGLYRR